MAFKKGQSGNPGGKVPGTKSNKTLAWERLGDMIVNEGAERYQKYLETLDDKKFADEFKSILEYFKPRQQKTEIKADIDVGPRTIGFEE